MTLPHIRSQKKVHPSALRRVINHYVKLADIAHDTTQELILVFDKANWIGLYWNNVSKDWHVSMHTQYGWNEISVLSTKSLNGYIKNLTDSFQNIYAIQYRNANGIDIYTCQTPATGVESN